MVEIWQIDKLVLNLLEWWHGQATRSDREQSLHSLIEMDPLHVRCLITFVIFVIFLNRRAEYIIVDLMRVLLVVFLIGGGPRAGPS